MRAQRAIIDSQAGMVDPGSSVWMDVCLPGCDGRCTRRKIMTLLHLESRAQGLAHAGRTGLTIHKYQVGFRFIDCLCRQSLAV